jgi:hypothetical protein
MPVGMAEVDAVLDAGDLASVGQLVPAERGIVQAVMGVGADEVKRGQLRRTLGPAEHGHGGIHLDMPVSLYGMMEPAPGPRAALGRR